MKRMTMVFLLVCMSGLVLAAEKVVENGVNPEGKAKSLQLKELHRVGPDSEDERYIWPGEGVKVTVSPEGHPIVIVPMENRMVEMDKQGKILRYHGGPGQGPGEFQLLMGLDFFNDGKAAAFEMMHASYAFTYYDKGLKVKDKKIKDPTHPLILQRARFNPAGDRIYAVWVSHDLKTMELTTSSGVLNRDMDILHQFSSDISPVLDPSRAMDANYWSEFLGSRMKLVAKGMFGLVDFDKKGAVYTAEQTKYQITKWDANFKEKKLVINKKYKPLPQRQADIDTLISSVRAQLMTGLPPQIQELITERVVAKGLEIAEFPPVKPPLLGIRTMGEYVLAIRDDDRVENTTPVDIFDKDGKFIGSYTHPARGFGEAAFSGDRVFVIEPNSDNEPELVIYQMVVKTNQS